MYGLVDGWVESQFLCTLGRLEGDEKMGDGAAVASERVLSFFGSEFGYFAFVNFLGFLDAQAYGQRVSVLRLRGPDMYQ